MSTTKTPRSTTTKAPRAERRVPAKAQAKAVAKPAATEVRKQISEAATDVKKQISEAVESAREISKRRMLAGMGLVARLRKQREERFAELVAEGKRVQPKVDKAIEDLKKKLRPEFSTKTDLSKFKPDLSKFKLDTSGFNRKAIAEKFEARMTESLHRIGLPTRKEVQSLARKVDKLAAAQEA
ncbi:MAG TPA: phasin family protein [Rubrivivax sp.]|nr:phasin family protein [Rubrivivax sp.]